MWKWGLRIDEICSSIVQGSVDFFFVVVSHLVGWSGGLCLVFFLFLLSHYFLFAVKLSSWFKTQKWKQEGSEKNY